jgi:hypothetical protein
MISFFPLRFFATRREKILTQRREVRYVLVLHESETDSSFIIEPRSPDRVNL